MALDSTVGGDSSNSYVSAVEADAYFTDHWSSAKTSAWADLTPAQRESVLKRATQILETLRFLDVYTGSGSLPAALVLDEGVDVTIHRMLEGQQLSFPRNLDSDADGNPFIPQDVKDAQCEQAVFLLTVDEAALVNQLQGVTEEAAGASGVRIYQNFGGGRGSLVAPMAYELLKKYFRSGSRRFRRA